MLNSVVQKACEYIPTVMPILLGYYMLLLDIKCLLSYRMSIHYITDTHWLILTCSTCSGAVNFW